MCLFICVVTLKMAYTFPCNLYHALDKFGADKTMVQIRAGKTMVLFPT